MVDAQTSDIGNGMIRGDVTGAVDCNEDCNNVHNSR